MADEKKVADEVVETTPDTAPKAAEPVSTQVEAPVASEEIELQGNRMKAGL